MAFFYGSADLRRERAEMQKAMQEYTTNESIRIYDKYDKIFAKRAASLALREDRISGMEKSFNEAMKVLRDIGRVNLVESLEIQMRYFKDLDVNEAEKGD